MAGTGWFVAGLEFSSELGSVVFVSVAPVPLLVFVVDVEVLFSGLFFVYQTKAAPPKTTNKTRTPTNNFVLPELGVGVVFNMFSSIFFYLINDLYDLLFSSYLF